MTKPKVCWRCQRPVRKTRGNIGLCRKCIELAKLYGDGIEARSDWPTTGWEGTGKA